MAGGARLRVKIDVQRLRGNMRMQGRTLTEQDIEAWLRVVGFEPEPRAARSPVVGDGTADGPSVGGTADAGGVWLTNADNLRCLDPSEILDVAPAG